MALSKEVNGRLVTNTDVEPPLSWTVNWEDMGIEADWGEDGDVADLVSCYGIIGEVRPLFRTSHRSNDVVFIIEINEQYYTYNHETSWVGRIVAPTDLKEIVDVINDRGWFNLEIENLDA